MTSLEQIQHQRSIQLKALKDISPYISSLQYKMSDLYKAKIKRCMGYNSAHEFDTCLKSYIDSHELLTKEFVHRTSYILNKHLKCTKDGFSRSYCKRSSVSALNHLENKLEGNMYF